MAQDPYGKDSIGRTEQLRPVASPVDTFVRPVEKEKSGLWQLAEGLSSLDEGLQAWVGQNKEQQKAENVARATADFYNNTKDGQAASIRKSPFFAGQSPEYHRTYAKLQGDALGQEYQTDLAGAWTLAPEHNSDDPNAFTQWQQNYTRQWFKEKGVSDPWVMVGIGPHVQNANENVRQQWTQERGQRIYQKTADAGSALVNATIDQAETEGLTRKGGTDYETVWGSAMSAREQALSSGMRAEDFDKQLFKTFAAKAIEHHDPHLLAMLDRELPGNEGTKYSDTPDGQKLKQDTTDKLTEIAASANRDERQAQRDADEQRYKENAGASLELIAKNPNAPIPDDVLKDMEHHDPFIREKLADARKKLSEGGPESDQALLHLQKNIMEGGGSQAVWDAVAAKTITRPETVRNMLEFAKTYDVTKEKANKFFESAIAKNIVTSIRGRTSPKNQLDVMGTVGGMSDAGMEADFDYRRLMVQWIAAHPNATETEAMEAGGKIGKLILDGINTEESTYAPPDAVKGVVQDNAFRQPDKPPAPEPIAPGTVWSRPPPADKPDQMQLWHGEQPPGYETLDENGKRLVDARAAVNFGAATDETRALTIKGYWNEIRAHNSQPAAGQQQQAGDPALPSQGLVEQGNIDLNARKVVNNADGTISTEVSFSREDGGVEVLVPRVVDGKLLSQQEAWAHYKQTGENLGKFDTPENANAYAEALHKRQEQHYAPAADGGGGDQSSLQGQGNVQLASFTQDTGGQNMPVPNQGNGVPNTQPASGEGAQGGTAQASLLQSIRSREAPQGYNQIYGGAVKAGVKQPDLSKMTVKEVFRFQRLMLAAQGGRKKSSAVGGYQFLTKTLKGLVKSEKLTGDEKFTPELQDRLAMALMKQRGLDDYLSGKISRERFANNLAKEWASLPVVSGSKRGRSYYAGDGLNKSFHKPEEILALVDSLIPKRA